MACSPDSFDLPLFHLRPPYAVFGNPIPHTSLPREELGPGSVLAIGIEAPGAALSILPRWVPRLRAEFPAAPVIVRLDAERSGEALQVAHRAARLGVRAAMTSDQPIEATLRPVLSHPVDLAGDVIEWLELRGVVFGPALRDLTRRIIASSEGSHSLGHLLAALRVAERTARARYRKKELPPPGDWLDFARGLYTALRIQREVETPLWELALELGYCDHSGLCKHMRRLFRARAGEIRRNLGWEWMAERWRVAQLAQAGQLAAAGGSGVRGVARNGLPGMAGAAGPGAADTRALVTSEVAAGGGTMKAQ